MIKPKPTIARWKDKLKNVPAFILGNSPSLDDEQVELIKPYFSVGINRAFYRLDTTILFWQDLSLYISERMYISKSDSVKVCRDTTDSRRQFYNYKLMNGSFKVPENPYILHGFGSTGPLAVQFAIALGCNPIVLLGMDCETRGESTDFYGQNKSYVPHTLPNCRRGLKWISHLSSERKIYSCSKDNVFLPYTPLTEVLSFLPPEARQNKEYWKSQLLK